jgi:hypothetical protein
VLVTLSARNQTTVLLASLLLLLLLLCSCDCCLWARVSCSLALASVLHSSAQWQALPRTLQLTSCATLCPVSPAVRAAAQHAICALTCLGVCCCYVALYCAVRRLQVHLLYWSTVHLRSSTGPASLNETTSH